MAVSSHLKIELTEYDGCIRTFIPDYEQMLDTAAAALRASGRPVRVLLDLGIGSGALAARCAAAAPAAALVGIDADAGMLKLAKQRLGNTRVALVHGDFARAELPACDAVVTSFALHHVPTPRRKTALYARCFAALRTGGLLVNADCCLASDRRVAAIDRTAWRAHLEGFYGRRQAEGFLHAWAEEDFYLKLEDELSMMRSVGFIADVIWRRHSFAVVVARKTGRR